MPSLYFKPTGEFLGENYDDVKELKEEFYEYDDQWWHWFGSARNVDNAYKRFEYIHTTNSEDKVPSAVLIAYMLLKE